MSIIDTIKRWLDRGTSVIAPVTTATIVEEREVWRDKDRNAKVSSVSIIGDKVVVCSYDDKSRERCRIDVVGGDSKTTQGGETIGNPALSTDGWWYFPGERSGIYRVRDRDGKLERYHRAQPRIWGASGAAGMLCYSDRNEDRTHPMVWNPRTAEKVYQFRRIIDIVSCLVRYKDKWVAFSEDGIEFEGGAYISGDWMCGCEIGGELIGCRKDGAVVVVSKGYAGKVIGNTGQKPQDIVPWKRQSALLATTNQDALWLVTPTKVSLVKRFSSDPTLNDGQLFGAAVAVNPSNVEDVAFGWTKGKLSGGAVVVRMTVR